MTTEFQLLHMEVHEKNVFFKDTSPYRNMTDMICVILCVLLRNPISLVTRRFQPIFQKY